jgi:two-component system KDP operon response regulator KdpE
MTLDQILVVDHESKWVRLLRQILTSAGFVVRVTHNGEQAVQIAADERPILVLAESCQLGEINGFDLVRRIRSFSDIPVIILSSSAEDDDVLRGFDAGADDYITKPFNSKILLARIKAVLYRSRCSAAVPIEIAISDLVINQAARQVTLNGLQIYLTETEYNLLLELATHSNQVMLHEQLLTAVWGPSYCTEVDYLRSYIHMLRRKLEKTPSQPTLIISRPGIGYMLVSAPSEASEAASSN